MRKSKFRRKYKYNIIEVKIGEFRFTDSKRNNTFLIKQLKVIGCYSPSTDLSLGRWGRLNKIWNANSMSLPATILVAQG